jgi:hypothetical protein
MWCSRSGRATHLLPMIFRRRARARSSPDPAPKSDPRSSPIRMDQCVAQQLRPPGAVAIPGWQAEDGARR